MINKACPKNPISFKDSVISFKEKSGPVQAKIDFEGLHGFAPYMNFINEGVGVRFMFLADSKHQTKDMDHGGEGLIMWSKTNGQFSWGHMGVFNSRSPLPGRLLEDKLPGSWLRVTGHTYYCEK